MNIKKQSQKISYANYHVGLKVLIKKSDKFLFLIDTDKQALDLPGGRIDETESGVSISEVIAREVEEELGKNLKYRLGEPIIQYRRHLKSGANVFITIYSAKYLSGKIKLSHEHSDFQWICPKKFDFKLEDFGYEEEFLAFKKYFGHLL